MVAEAGGPQRRGHHASRHHRGRRSGRARARRRSARRRLQGAAGAEPHRAGPRFRQGAVEPMRVRERRAREERRLGLDLWDDGRAGDRRRAHRRRGPGRLGQGVRLRRPARRARAVGRPADQVSALHGDRRRTWRHDRDRRGRRAGARALRRRQRPRRRRRRKRTGLAAVRARHLALAVRPADARAFAGVRTRRDAARGDLRDRQHHPRRRRAVHDSRR